MNDHSRGPLPPRAPREPEQEPRAPDRARRALAACLEAAARAAAAVDLGGGCALFWHDEPDSPPAYAGAHGLPPGAGDAPAAHLSALLGRETWPLDGTVVAGAPLRGAGVPVPSGLIAVPLRLGGRVFGLLAWFPLAPGRPAPAAVAHLEGFAEGAAGALREAQLLLELAATREREERRARGVLALQRVGKAMAVGQAVGLEGALRTVVRELSCTFAYPLVVLALIVGEPADPAARLEVLAEVGMDPGVARAIPLTRGVAGRVARTGEAVLLTDSTTDGDFFSQFPGEVSSVCVPIIQEGRPIGIINVEQPGPPALTGHDLDLLRLVGEHVGLLVANTRLHTATETARREAERRAQGLAALVDVGMQIAAEDDYRALLATIDRQIARLIPSENAAIFLREARTGDLVVERMRQEAAGLPARVPQGEGLVGWVVAHGEPLLIGDTAADPRYYDITNGQLFPTSMLFAPLPGQRGAQGAIGLARYSGPGFTALDRDLLAAFAQQAAVVLEQTRLRAEQVQRADELASLNAIATATASLDLDLILRELVARTRRLTGADACAIDLLDEGGAMLTMRALNVRGEAQPAGVAIPFDLSASGQVIRAGRAQLWPEATLGPLSALGLSITEGRRGSLIGAPLIAKGRIIGTILASLEARDGFTEAHLRFLETVAAQAAVAVENARLHAATDAARDEAERRALALAALLDIGTTIAAQQDYGTLMAAIVEQINRLIPTDTTAIMLAEPETGDLVMDASTHRGARVGARRVPRGQGLSGWVMDRGEPLLSNDAPADPRRYGGPGSHEPPRALLLAPLPGRQGPQGVIILGRLAGPDFTPLDRDLLVAFGQQAGVVLTQTRLREAQANRAEELAALNAIAVATASLDLDRVLHELVARTRALVGADTCAIALIEEPTGTLVARAADGLGAALLVGQILPLAGSFSGEVIRSGRAAFWADTRSSENRSLLGPHNGHERPASLIGVPLIAQGRVIGAMIATVERPNGFGEEHLRFAQTVGAQAAVAVENARLYADTLRLARYDPLTGLANRRYFVESLTTAVKTATRYARPLALLVIDIDHFKVVNDSHGHPAGDAVLAQIADRLRRELRASDFPVRYAGDELAVILPETDLPGAVAVAERLRAAVANAPIPLGEAGQVSVTLSIGVGSHIPGESAADLLHVADRAMYFAKHSGRNRVCGPEAAREALDRTPEHLAEILQGGNQRVIEELSAAVDARLLHSVGQATRVASVAAALGVALGLAAPAIQTLRSAALVHDIGEIAIPTEILERPGPLAAWEWDLVRAHPVYGRELLANVPAFRDSLPLILSHHEWWDGGGYPEGLAGEAIPLGARIIAVADAWVALTTDRPYRAALPYPEALREILRHDGGQFDPAVVAALPGALAAVDPEAGRALLDRPLLPKP